MPENLLDQIFQALQATSLVVSFDGDHKSSSLFVGNGESQIIISSADVEPYEGED
ncbi:MAG: hypothetical protein HC851_20135 [Acaryochloris sp. RU_4_1]|nr:hypothetical protein [Acaryochloris sp. RU_4_1]NJR56866.1 hypothetical protein [Acaryochloris sp. CRU_2_0]